MKPVILTPSGHKGGRKHPIQTPWEFTKR